MALQFNPTILKQGSYHELPCPITKLQIQDRWDFSRFKVLLQQGDELTGHSRNGVDISVSGSVASQNGQLLLSEEEMFDEVEKLRLLFETQREEKFSFFLYRDVASSTYRYFQDCLVTRFQCDLSQANLYSYSVQIHAENPVIQTELSS